MRTRISAKPAVGDGNCCAEAETLQSLKNLRRAVTNTGLQTGRIHYAPSVSAIIRVHSENSILPDATIKVLCLATQYLLTALTASGLVLDKVSSGRPRVASFGRAVTA